MGKSAKYLHKRYFKFFIDNNLAQRVTFFRDPLIQCLWKKFMQDYEEKIAKYIEQIGQAKDRDREK